MQARINSGICILLDMPVNFEIVVVESMNNRTRSDEIWLPKASKN